tara:strand:- start:512 stop:814 length:303 start_codon:yes stop_codon:yes gene_type:complete
MKSNKQIAQHHMYNSDGLVAKKHANDEIISNLVDEGKCKSGAIIAYGTLSYFWTDNLWELARKQRVDTIKLSVAIECLEDQIAKQVEFINKISNQTLEAV